MASPYAPDQAKLASKPRTEETGSEACSGRRISMKVKAKRILLALAATMCVLIWVLVRRPPSIPRSGASEASTVDRAKDPQVDEGLTDDDTPEGRRSLG